MYKLFTSVVVRLSKHDLPPHRSIKAINDDNLIPSLDSVFDIMVDSISLITSEELGVGDDSTVDK